MPKELKGLCGKNPYMDHLASTVYILLAFLLYLADLFISLSICQSTICFDAFQSLCPVTHVLALIINFSTTGRSLDWSAVPDRVHVP